MTTADVVTPITTSLEVREPLAVNEPASDDTLSNDRDCTFGCDGGTGGSA